MKDYIYYIAIQKSNNQQMNIIKLAHLVTKHYPHGVFQKV